MLIVEMQYRNFVDSYNRTIRHYPIFERSYTFCIFVLLIINIMSYSYDRTYNNVLSQMYVANYMGVFSLTLFRYTVSLFGRSSNIIRNKPFVIILNYINIALCVYTLIQFVLTIDNVHKTWYYSLCNNPDCDMTYNYVYCENAITVELYEFYNKCNVIEPSNTTSLLQNATRYMVINDFQNMILPTADSMTIINYWMFVPIICLYIYVLCCVGVVWYDIKLQQNIQINTVNEMQGRNGNFQIIQPILDTNRAVVVEEVTGELNTFNEGECPICLERPIDIRTKCNHGFCLECIKKLKNNQCPMCRSTLTDS